MTLDTVFSKSFKDYKKNFKITVLATLLFRLLPILIIAPILFFLVTIPYIDLTADFVGDISQIPSAFNYTNTNDVGLMSLTGNAISGSEGTIISEFIEHFRQIALIYLRATPFYLLLWVLGLFFSINLFYASFNNKEGKLKFGEALRKSSHYFWKFLLFLLLIYAIIFLLIIGIIAVTFLLIITLIGIVLVPFLMIGFFILLVYLSVVWGLAVYFIFDEDCRVIESLGKSRQLVKGNFWRVLGYILLMGLILLGVSLVFWLIGLLITIPFGAGISSPEITLIDFNKASYITSMTRQSLAGSISSNLNAILGSLTIAPFMIFFFKNLYQELKEEKKKTAKKKKAG